MVQPGYARCPRCTMPQKAARGSDKGHGGTAVDGASSRTTLVALGMLLAVAIIVLVLRKGDSEKVAPGPGTTAAPTAPAGATIATENPPAGPSGEVGFVPDESLQQESESRQAVAIAIQKTLSGKRFWASVSVDPQLDTQIIISSATCAENDMKALLFAQGPLLLEAGFTVMRCVEKHGALVFEQVL